MVNLPPQALAVYEYTSIIDEIEWTRMRKALDFLDLAEHGKSLFDKYKNNSDAKEVFRKNIWIQVSSSVPNHPIDDCRPLFKWSSDETESIFFHLTIKYSKLNWFGRNIFFEYLRRKIGLNDLRLACNLELGECPLRFMKIATLCGFYEWRRTIMFEKCASDFILFAIYPSILKEFYQVREEHPFLVMKFLDMFCYTKVKEAELFSLMPDEQGLNFLLGVANQAHFIFRSLQSSFLFEEILQELIKEKCFKELSVILRHGYTYEKGPLKLMLKIYRYLNQRDVGMLEIYRNLVISYPLSLPRIEERIERWEREPKPDMEFMAFYRMMINSLPLHLPPSKEEKREILKKVRRVHGKVPNSLRVLLNAYNVYAMDIRDNRGINKLKHLCRCVVRSRLRDNFQLPTGIYALGLPVPLEKYLDFDF